ncbi:hypothetical protein E3P77_03727 [Wallemia ichthyophaga]|uniref:PNPLA domain-containing protein n=1 Tax=Wallemia ichthyophaga TaxID=245174 RepID=A0A4T0GLG5_WALIC|nr:hypothetical protein E3P96_03026 [Wallemia ichthyophaga]TIB01537.1 hypothetical protein E3P95_01347 [Wallemia ichthyophaga]TIB02405.1 hypothetical protein E3P94_01479 [Wallemia ichthyophaga]TIB14651.1 hypothetical protein E3P90_01155 [Wallemia ichthyophaga]TIB16530.1 hypothetical protein E3P93_00906 [Wallemia ichthyophaga]
MAKDETKKKRKSVTADDAEAATVDSPKKESKKSKTEEDEIPIESLSPIAHPLAGAKTRNLRRGVKEVVKGVKKGEKGVVIMAANISPIDILTHIPVLCEESAIPYVFVASKEELGEASGTKRPTSCMMVVPKSAKSKKGEEDSKEKLEEWKLDDELNNDYIDQSHIQAFRLALSQIDSIDEDTRISALSDFAPVHERVKRRRKPKVSSGFSWGYTTIRYPLLIILFFTITIEFIFYVSVRQIVNLWEWAIQHRGKSAVIRQKMRNATNFHDWKKAAVEMDHYLDLEKWKSDNHSGIYYDSLLVQKVLSSLKDKRQNDDIQGLIGVLEICIKNNFAGTESSRLYSETFYGSKVLIEDYINEVSRSLSTLRDHPSVSIEQKRILFKSFNRNFGQSALCLSGGGSFGYYHFGVLKAFLEAGLLPRVITELADKIKACEDSFSVWFPRWWRTGARFDTIAWAEKSMFFTRGTMTFQDAYERTGRSLNISVTPSDRHSPTKILNHLTAPDCVIWSAIIASAAVPGILPPVVLMRKCKDGSIEPFSLGARFKDGSIRVDIPLQSLNLRSAGKPVAHRRGQGWRGGFFLAAAESYLKLELSKNLKVIRDLELMPEILATDFSSVFLQKFEGSITIWPRTRFLDWIHILSDPDRPELKRMMKMGQLATWPKLHIVENRFKIEREILKGRHMVRDTLKMNRMNTKSVEQLDAASVATNSDFESKQVDATAQGNIERLNPINDFNKSEVDSEASTSDNESEPSELLNFNTNGESNNFNPSSHQNVEGKKQL